MKTMNNNNNIENEKNVKNVVANNAAEGAQNAAEPLAERVAEESRKAYGSPSINEAKGWKLDHVIAFDLLHNAYIKGSMPIDKLTQTVCEECGIKPEDTSNWAKDVRTMIRYCIESYDMTLDYYKENPDQANKEISACGIGDALCFRCEAYYPAEAIMPHTFEAEKEYYQKSGNWERFLRGKEMTESERKAYLDKLQRTEI